jgi:glycine/D-amino acid oxidase-like deaminating enzyme
MRVMVLGAGVIGTSSAYYLAKSGHEVVVVDRRSGPALETSFANAGGICPGFAGPWAAPGMPTNIVRWLFTRHAPLVLRPRFDPHQWRWLIRFLRNCSAERFARNKARMQRIAHYSKACLKELREDTGIAFDHGTGGVLQLFRTEEELAGAAKSTRVLAEFGVMHRMLDAKGVLAVEPRCARPPPTSQAASICPMTRPATATNSRSRWPSFCIDAASSSSSTRAWNGCVSKALASPASLPIKVRSTPTPMSWRWAARPRASCGHWASIFRSIR